jgi:hypothetical protein
MDTATLLLQWFLAGLRSLHPSQALRLIFRAWNGIRALWQRVMKARSYEADGSQAGRRARRSSFDGRAGIARAEISASRFPPSSINLTPRRPSRRARDDIVLDVLPIQSHLAVQASRSSTDVRSLASNNPYRQALSDERYASSPNIGQHRDHSRSSPHIPLEGIAIPTLETLGIPVSGSRPESPASTTGSVVEITVQSPTEEPQSSSGPFSDAQRPTNDVYAHEEPVGGHLFAGYNVSHDVSTSVRSPVPDHQDEAAITTEVYLIRQRCHKQV